MSTGKVPKNNADSVYQELLKDILKNGVKSGDRTGTGTIKVFGRMLKFDLSEGFPLLTTKKVWFHGVKEELLWFIRGERNLRPLVLKNVGIWNEWPYQRYLVDQKLDKKYTKYSPEWEEKMKEFIEKIKSNKSFADKYGDLGPVYGYKWRNWEGKNGKKVDQLADAIKSITKNPDSRRIIVTAWDPSVLSEVALPPCHMEYQFQVVGKKLNCFMVQRSVDTFLGLPFNIASYALLTSIVARVTGKLPGTLTMALADTHIYLNHIKQAKEQIRRVPKPLPKLRISSKLKNIDHIGPDWINVVGYDPHPAIKAPISV